MKKKKDEPLEEISANRVYDVIQMANKIYTKPSMYFDASLLNNNLSTLVDDPLIPTEAGLESALNSYTDKNSSELLQSYNDFMEVYDVFIQKIIDYLSNLLSFDLTWACRNDYMTEEDYKSKDFKEDSIRRNRFLDTLRVKEEFPKILKNVIKRGGFFVYLRGSKDDMSDKPMILNDSELNYAIQPMPQEYCTLESLYKDGLLWNFDMSYFNRAGTSVKAYPPIFEKYLDKVYDTSMQKEYNPNAPLNKRNAVSTTKVQTSPDDGAWYFKWDSSNLAVVPYLSNMILQCLDSKAVSALQKDKDIIGASAMIIGDMPINNKQQDSKKSDMFAIQPETAITFMELVKRGLKKNINAIMMPTEGSKLYQFQDYNKEMSNNKNKETAGKGVSASGLIYSSEKSSQSETYAQISNDFALVSRMYRQFEAFLNFYVNRKMKKYKWNFTFVGSNQPYLREQHKKNIMEASALGFVMNESMWSTLVGIPPQDYIRSMQEAKYGALQDNLVSLQSIHTTNNQNQETLPNKTKEVAPIPSAGAPLKDEGNIKDSGSEAREYK